MNNIKMTPVIHIFTVSTKCLFFNTGCKLITCTSAALLYIWMVCFTFPSFMWAMFD